MKVMLKFETMYYYLLLKLYAAVVIDIQDEAGQSNIFVASFIFYNWIPSVWALNEKIGGIADWDPKPKGVKMESIQLGAQQ